MNLILFGGLIPHLLHELVNRRLLLREALKHALQALDLLINRPHRFPSGLKALDLLFNGFLRIPGDTRQLLLTLGKAFGLQGKR